MTKVQSLRAEFDYALSQENGFGRKVLTLMLLFQIAILTNAIVGLLNA
jgi:hypothetical protein